MLKPTVPENSLIGVYGSLKSGFYNHRIIEGARFVGKFCTKPDYKLYCNGCFPYMIQVESGTGVSIECEIYEVTPEQVKRMDRLEGHPTMYKRLPVELIGIEGVEGYIYQHKPESRCRDAGNSWPIIKNEQVV